MENQQESQSTELDILLEIDGSRRPLRVTAFTAIERELGKMGKDISLLPLGVSDISDKVGRTKVPYVLQRWCSKFNTFIDVTDKSQFTDGNRLTVSPLACPISSSVSASSSEVKLFVLTYKSILRCASLVVQFAAKLYV